MNVSLYWKESFTAPGDLPIWESRFTGRFPDEISRGEIFRLMDKEIPGLTPADGFPCGTDLLVLSEGNVRLYFERGAEGWVQLEQCPEASEIYPGPAACRAAYHLYTAAPKSQCPQDKLSALNLLNRIACKRYPDSIAYAFRQDKPKPQR